MSNGDKRKAHIKRIYKDDDPDSDQWIDVERLDELSFEQGKAEQYRLKRWTFDWDSFDEKNATKKQILDPDDEANWTEVPIRNTVFVQEGGREQYQGNKHWFKNTEDNKTRETHSRLVYHHDIGDPPPSDPDEYLKALGDQDIDQYVEVELLDRYWTQEELSKDAEGGIKPSQWQNKKWKLSEIDPLLQDPMLPTDRANPDFVPVYNPNDGIIDPPWRLDPLQNIVNVQWGGLAVIFGKGIDNAPQQKKDAPPKDQKKK